MRVFDSPDIRNVALIGHGHSGKTALASAMLFTASATDRLLKPDEGNTVTDFDEEEVARKLSISSGIAAFAWQKTKLNVIDTPGYNMFLNDTRSAMAAADGVVTVLDGVAGVEVSAVKVWGFAEEFALPAAILVNKLDRERSSFDRVVANAQEKFGRSVIPVHLPVGAERNFTGIIDLIRMRCWSYTAGGDGKGKEGDIPEALKEAASAGHEALVEMVAEGNDELLEEFFATGTLPCDHLISGLQQAVRDRRIFPALCCSAAQNAGADLLMSFLAEVFPSPLARNGLPAVQNGKEIEKSITPNEPPSVFVFKTAADPFAGRVTYFKVMSGTVKDDAHLTNARSNSNERLGHIATPFGKTMQPIAELRAGDIGEVAKLKETLTGDTLCEKDNCATFGR